jgi:hypothetical protein
VTSGTAREALVAELLGDTERMLDRIDAVMAKLGDHGTHGSRRGDHSRDDRGPRQRSPVSFTRPVASGGALGIDG